MKLRVRVERIELKLNKPSKVLIVVIVVAVFLFSFIYWIFPWYIIENTKSKCLRIMQNINSTETKNDLRLMFDRDCNYTELLTWLHGKLNFSWEKIERHQDPFEILEYGKGRCEEFSILYVSVCLAHGYRTRLVVDIFGDHMWAEISLFGKWVHVDPSERRVDDPYMYERDWNKNIKVVYAFEDGRFEDVTLTYREIQ